jgi:patatin-like phospholipase/acyl hydrolase
MRTFQTILSIDGGGIRGIIPATTLAYIEKQTGKRISELFDLIAGTSTGGILALGLTMPRQGGPYRAEELISFYQEEGPKIFPPRGWLDRRRIAAKWCDLLCGPKYDHRNVECILKKMFRDATLGDALVDVAITAYDVTKRTTKILTSWVAPSCTYRMWEVARATCAAPTYFAPFRPSWAVAGGDTLIDGGVFANNPGLYAFLEAKERYKVPNDQILLVSLGTGVLCKEYHYDIVKGWGEAGWAKPIIDITFFSICETVDYALAQLLGGAGQPQQFYRYQVKLAPASEDLDNASQLNFGRLKQAVSSLIIQSGTASAEKWLNPDLNTLCLLLQDNRARKGAM